MLSSKARQVAMTVRPGQVGRRPRLDLLSAEVRPHCRTLWSRTTTPPRPRSGATTAATTVAFAAGAATAARSWLFGLGVGDKHTDRENKDKDKQDHDDHPGEDRQREFVHVSLDDDVDETRVTFGKPSLSPSSPPLPNSPASMPDSDLSHDFLVRQSCALSAEGASRTLTQVVMAVQDCVGDYAAAMSELANLYEDSVLALSDEGGHRASELQVRAAQLKTKVQDLEMLFTFVKKLMDANAEVCFLAGAHFASTQSSERLHAADTLVTGLFNRAKLAELDLLKAKQSHIEATARIAESRPAEREAETTEKTSEQAEDDTGSGGGHRVQEDGRGGDGGGVDQHEREENLL